MDLDLNFWKDKRVFLTGHTGFKGSWLSLWLQSLGSNLTGFALDPYTKPSFFELANIERDMHSIIGDIRDFKKIKNAIDNFKPEIIIHMAAQPIVRRSYKDPIETYSTNIMGTVHLLEAAREIGGVKAFLNVTSDKCYENKEVDIAYSEDQVLGGHDPYSSSKACSEIITKAYHSSFFDKNSYLEHGVSLASVRAGNVIGGGDWSEDRLIPDVIRAIQRNENFLIRKPLAIRPWQHVLEPLSGYLKLIEFLFIKGPDYAEAWNFGPYPDQAKSVKWIASSLIEYWASNINIEFDSHLNPHEANYLKLDISKAIKKLNWRPKWDTYMSIIKICEWHKAHINNEDMRAFTLNQIQEYIKYKE